MRYLAAMMKSSSDELFLAPNLRKSQILPHTELHRSEKSAKKPNHITYASVKAIFFQWSLEWFSLTGSLSPSEKFKAEWQPKPWAPELEMLLECRCVWLSKTREIASEVGERVCLFFKDCFNEIKKKNCFSSGAFSVQLMFLFFCLLESDFCFCLRMFSLIF